MMIKLPPTTVFALLIAATACSNDKPTDGSEFSRWKAQKPTRAYNGVFAGSPDCLQTAIYARRLVGTTMASAIHFAISQTLLAAHNAFQTLIAPRSTALQIRAPASSASLAPACLATFRSLMRDPKTLTQPFQITRHVRTRHAGTSAQSVTLSIASATKRLI